MMLSISTLVENRLVVTKGQEISIFAPTPVSRLKAFNVFFAQVNKLAPKIPDEAVIANLNKEAQEQIITEFNQNTNDYYNSQVNNFFTFLVCELGDINHTFNTNVINFIKNIYKLNYPKLHKLDTHTKVILGDPKYNLQIDIELLRDYSHSVNFKRSHYQFGDTEYLLLELLGLEQTRDIALELWQTCSRDTLVKYVFELTTSHNLRHSNLNQQIIKQLISEKSIEPLKKKLFTAIDAGIFNDTSNWEPLHFPGQEPRPKSKGDPDERLKTLEKTYRRNDRKEQSD